MQYIQIEETRNVLLSRTHARKLLYTYVIWETKVPREFNASAHLQECVYTTRTGSRCNEYVHNIASLEKIFLDKEMTMHNIGKFSRQLYITGEKQFQLQRCGEQHPAFSDQNIG